MAAIDKIYGTKAQYDEFKEWCIKNKHAALKHFWDWEWKDDGEDGHPITSFPPELDYWMFFNCPIKFVTDRIFNQYGLEDKVPSPTY